MHGSQLRQRPVLHGCSSRRAGASVLRPDRRVAHAHAQRRHPYREEGRLAYEPAQAENELEFYYHPEVYHREFCPSLRKPNTPCSHDRLCHRAHSLEEFLGRFYHPQQAVLPQPFSDNAEFMVLRWKTISCPWLHWPHIWARCPYHHRFHNQNMASLMKPDLDWRRTLFNDKGMINYWPEPCPIASEGRSCPNGAGCENTHTKAEFMYHPEKYRRRECQYGALPVAPYNACCMHSANEFNRRSQLPAEHLLRVHSPWRPHRSGLHVSAVAADHTRVQL